MGLAGVAVSLGPAAAGRWAIEGTARLTGAAEGRCRAAGSLAPFGERHLKAEVDCDRPLTWAPGYRELAVRFGRFSLDLRAGGEGHRLSAGLDSASVVRLASEGGAEVELLRGRVRVESAREGRIRVRADVEPASGPGRIKVSGTVLPSAREAAFDLNVEGLDVAKTPLVRVLPVTVHAGRLAADVAVDVNGGLDDVDIIGHVSLTDLAVEHPKLAATPVGGLRGRLDLDVAVDVPGRSLRVYRNVWTVNGLSAEVDGMVALTPTVRLDLTARSGPHSGEALSLALPPALVPTITPLELEGTWEAALRLNLDAAKPKDTKLKVRLDVDDLAVTQLGSVRLERVLTRFRRRFLDPETEEEDSFMAGPQAPGFVPVEAIPWTLQMALLSQEDGGFYKHGGFSLLHVRGALARNIQLGRFARGASTISMQTVKNVFLSPEKTLSRKVQEVFLTWQLEEFLDKADILELYLNVIEWGPRLFGVGAAARHYFGKTPDELTPLECLYLATMVPSPRFYHEQFVEGRVGRKHKRRIERLMRLMVRRRHLTQEELDEAEGMGWVPELAEYDAEEGEAAEETEEAEEE